MLRRRWVRVRVATDIAVHCMAMSVDQRPNEWGTYNGWFCRRWRWHRGEHRDPGYPGAVWDRNDN